MLLLKRADVSHHPAFELSLIVLFGFVFVVWFQGVLGEVFIYWVFCAWGGGVARGFGWGYGVFLVVEP